MGRTAYHPERLYPELARIQSHFTTIRTEALAARPSMIPIKDSRAEDGAWKVLPILPEEEDRGVFPKELVQRSEQLVPRTAELLLGMPTLQGCAISLLEAGGRIAAHGHDNPFVTAALCLEKGGRDHLLVAGERRDFRHNEWIIFDYTLEHEVANYGPRDRVVLLVLLENRLR